MSSPRARPKSDTNIEKHREEGNWQRCLELAQLSTDHKELQNFLTGEAKLELFLEEIAKKNGDPKTKHNHEIDSTMLEEAKTYLKKCIEGNNETPLMMDANLLLAKAYYISGDYHEALNFIRQSGIDSIASVDRNLPLRVIKLIAESYTVKGMSLEKISHVKPLKYIDQVYDLADSYAKSAEINGKNNNNPLLNNSSIRKISTTTTNTFEDDESFKAQIDCLHKASLLSMRYVHGITHVRGPYIIINLGCILESALLKTHHVYIKHNYLNEAIDYCRRMLNICETNSTLNIRQMLSKELAEIFIKGMCRSVWRRPELLLKQQQNPPIYFGNSLFQPNEYEEEVMLLLMLSEVLASLNVLLERSSDLHESRIQSLNNVLLIQDLFTMFLVPLQCYYVDTYERAMKYSFEVKHVWYQFALTLMESKKSPLRSFLLLKEVIRMDPSDPIPNLFAAKLCMVELCKYKDAIEILEDSLKRLEKLLLEDNQNRKKNSIIINNNDDLIKSLPTSQSTISLIDHIQEIYGEQNLLHYIHLLIGIANALQYESDTETSKKFKQKYLENSIKHLNESIEQDFFGNDHLPYFHLALHMAHQRMLKQAVKYVRVALLLNSNHLPSIQLLILCLTALKQYDDAYDLCQQALKEYQSHLILLYLKAHLERICCENGHELALLTAKEMLKQWRMVSGEEYRRLSPRASYCSFIPTMINYDTMSLRMEQTLSEVISLDSAPILPGNVSAATTNNNTNLNDLSFGQNDRLYLSQASSVNGSNLVLNENKPCSQAFEMQIWLLIVELFLQLDQVNEAETCVNDGAVAVFGQLSHQLMYIKGVISKKRGQYYDAKVHFHNAISINPKHAQALQQLGHTYHMLGNQIIAEKYLKDSLNIDSTKHETWCYLGLVLNQMDEHERATECHLTSLRLEESSPLLPFSIIPRCVLE